MKYTLIINIKRFIRHKEKHMIFFLSVSEFTPFYKFTYF